MIRKSTTLGLAIFFSFLLVNYFVAKSFFFFFLNITFLLVFLKMSNTAARRTGESALDSEEL